MLSPLKKLCLILILSSLSQAAFADSKTLIVYFSHLEDTSQLNENLDAYSGASILEKNGNYQGNVEYMAKLIQKETGADIWQASTIEEYPTKHNPLLTLARKQLRQNFKPKLVEKIPNLTAYDTVFLGYPIWWGQLPPPVQTLLEENDLSYKKIIPFISHGGSGFVRTVQTISRLQPNADIVSGIEFFWKDVSNSHNDISTWLKKLGYK